MDTYRCIDHNPFAFNYFAHYIGTEKIHFSYYYTFYIIKVDIIDVPLFISSGSTVDIRESDFSSSHVTAEGGSTTTIDLTRNWWGSTDVKTIEASIWDGTDDPALGSVDFEPYAMEPFDLDVPEYE